MLSNIITNLRESQNTAFVINDISYSYHEFGKLVETYYRFIEQQPELKLIGVVMHNDLQTYAFITATFLSNCGYVIINLAHPIERNSLIASEAGLSHVVSSVATDISVMPDFLVFTGLDTIPGPATEIEFQKPDPESIAYILFTSGSTGTPKGVKITKKNLNAFIVSLFSTQIEPSATDSFLQLYDLTFDASILMLVPALCKGATIYTANLEKMKIIDVARILTTYPITYVFLVPSVIALLRSFLSDIHVPSLKTLLIGGEAVTETIVNEFRPSIPNAALWNFYGPTEGTVGVVIKKIENEYEPDLYNDVIPIGKPMPGVLHLILDDDGIVVETDRKGELLIGGDQVTDGYVNDEYKNQVSFTHLKYNGRLERFYKTGDIVYLTKNGNYAYCGRRDHQVKIRGLRIELNEIEYHARKITNKMAVAIVKELDGNPQLYLFVEDYKESPDTLISYLEQKLPPFMVPRNIINLDRLPVSSSDKIDRMKLSEYI